jgi:glutaredoxin 3
MKEITIYSTPTCHFCQLAKVYFKEHGFAYTEHNVATDLEKRKEMVQMTGQLGVPVIKIGDAVLVGFQEEKIASLLAA